MADMRIKKGNYLQFFVYLTAVILINTVGLTLFFRLDLTRDGMYSLSDVSKEVVSTLSEPLTIKVFFTRSLPAPHNNTERYLRDLLEEYAVHANRFFNFQFYDVSPEAAGAQEQTRRNQDIAESYGIYPLQIQVFEEDEVKFKKAFMGLVMIHGDLVERVPAITSTDALEYKLTTAIQKMNNKISALLNLEKPVEVQLVLSSSLYSVAPHIGLPQLPDYPKKLEEMVVKLSSQHYGKLRFDHTDPSLNPVAEKSSENSHLIRLQWPAIEQQGILAGQGTIGLVLRHEENSLEIPILDVLRIPVIGTQYRLAGTEQLEEMILDGIEKLVDINEDIGILAGHGTFTTSSFSPSGTQSPDAIGNFADLLRENYTIKTVSLGDEAVPEGLNCLVIPRPTEPFSDYELFQIDQALMRGTNLAFFIDAFKEEAPPRQASLGMPPAPVFMPLDTGLEKLLAHYGIQISRSIVLDENCYRQNMPRHMGGGEQAVYFAPIIKQENIDHRLGFMKNIRGLITVKASPLVLDEERIQKNEIQAHRLIASSNDSWEMKDRITLNPVMMVPPQSNDEKRSFPLAYLIEGKFSSFFADKPIPEKISAVPQTDLGETPGGRSQLNKKSESFQALAELKTEGGRLLRSQPAKIFVMASSEMLHDSLLETEGDSTNTMFIMNLLDALNNREEIAIMRSKIQRYNPLNETTAGSKTFIKTFSVIGLPVLVILSGLVVWIRRRSHKRRIHDMFTT